MRIDKEGQKTVFLTSILKLLKYMHELTDKIKISLKQAKIKYLRRERNLDWRLKRYLKAHGANEITNKN